MHRNQPRRQPELGEQPWLTLLIALTALAWMGWSDLTTRAADAKADASLAVAVDTLLAHPYLDAPEVVAARIGEEALETRRQVYRGELRRNGSTGPSAEERAQGERDFGAAMSDYADAVASRPIARFGFAPGHSALHTALSHAIAHASWLACVANLLAFVLLGSLAERSFGVARFAVLAVGAVLASAGFAALALGDRGWPLAGLGGAIAGLLGASSASWLRGRREPGASLAIAFGTAWFAAPYLLAREWSLASAAAAPVELSALLSPWIHAAGLGFGCSFGLVAPHARRRGRLAARPRAGEGAESLLQLAEQALHAGDRERAFSLLSQRIHESPGDRAAGLSLWQVGRALGRNLDAVAALLRVVRDELRSNMHDECVAHWLELAQVDQPIRVEPALLIALAPLLEARGHRDEALAALESALADRECSSAHAAQIALAAEPLDPELAQRAAWRAQADAAPEPALRREPAARAPAAEAREAAAPSSPTPNSIPSSEPEEAVVDLVEPVAWSPPGSERVQWEDPQLRPEEGTAAGGDLHGAVSLDALQVDVSLASKAPLELPRAPSAPRRDARAARASAAPAPSAEPSPPPRTSRRPDSREKSERALDVLEAIPVELTESALRLEIIGVGKKKLRYAQLQALGAASIRAESGGPLFAIDLVLNWRDARGEPLKVVRLRSDRFDPIALVGDAESAPAAIRQLVALLLERSGASALPDAHSARGLPFREFPSFETYQRDVLMPEL